MTTGLKIKEVADVSGFTAAALRYYEQIGLLPVTTRSPAGYRLDESGTLDRLAFIARAKQLGCNLEEIIGLTTAWEGGLCGPVQDQLSHLVVAKISDAERQIAELTTFKQDLEDAAIALSRHRPEGACDTRCGCISQPGDDPSIGATIQPISLSTTRASRCAPEISDGRTTGPVFDRAK